MSLPLIFVREGGDGASGPSFALTNAFFSYVFRVTPEGHLEHVHYGGPIRHPHEGIDHHLRTERHAVTHYQGIPDYSLSDLPQEYPGFGRSDYRYPAFHARNEQGNSVFDLTYKDHHITSEKPRLKTLPSAQGQGSETLIVTLSDDLHGLEVDLHYTLYHDYGVLVRSATYRNVSRTDIELQHVFSTALDLPPDTYDALHLWGTWAREMNAERVPLPHGRFTVDSARGTSSAAHNPFIAVMQKDATEAQGRVFATTLIYSGNHALSVETGEFGDVRVLAGINPFTFGWRLAPGAEFETPEALHVFSDQGQRGMSHIFHDFIRNRITPERFRACPRPTYLNTWEAAYFDVDEGTVLELAETACRIGVDMLVLDDGWFAGRQDDTTSLGDWTADPVRFPSGIADLATRVRAKGLKFGLWIEPEMVGPDSELYRAHPEWALHVPGRTPSLGRNQLTIDLSRRDVQDHLYHVIDDLLACGKIDYVKWDMNRNMSEVGSAALAPDQQDEVAHRYMIGLYSVLDRLTTRYPNILFENCASGGNRMDLGMLSYFAQTWTSDLCDPVGRLDILSGASLYLPLDCLAAYVGPSPNHQNGRVTSLRTRMLAGAVCAARGLSLSEADLRAHEADLKSWMEWARKTAPDMLGGRFDRLMRNRDGVVYQYLTQDKARIYVTCFHILSAPNLPFRRVRLTGLDPKAHYRLIRTASGETDRKDVFHGDSLMQFGLPLPYVTLSQTNPDMRYMPPGDFSSELFVMERVGDGNS